MKYLSVILFALFVLLSSQTKQPLATVAFPYGDAPLWVQVNDTDQIEISYIFYDQATKRVVVRGSLEQGLMHLNRVYQETIVPAQELNYAAGRIRQQLNSNGTVRKRDSLTMAIRYYDSVRNKWGIIQ